LKKYIDFSLYIILIVLYFSSKGSLTQYLPESRNFLKSDKHKLGKSRFVHKGRENVLNFIDKLPKTKHDLGSFIVDVPLANVSINIFVLVQFVLHFSPSSLQWSRL